MNYRHLTSVKIGKQTGMTTSYEWTHTEQHDGNTVGQDQEFWTNKVWKWHFKEWYIWYNYTLFIWVTLNDKKKWTILTQEKKDTYGEWQIEVSLYHT
jgi:hypothetical protein